MFVLEQASVITDLKGGNAETREEQSGNNSAVLRQCPGSSRDIHNNMSLSSAGTKAPIQVEDGIMMLTLLTSINQSLDSVNP